VLAAVAAYIYLYWGIRWKLGDDYWLSPQLGACFLPIAYSASWTTLARSVCSYSHILWFLRCGHPLQAIRACILWTWLVKACTICWLRP
jgi:hypothetical protein